MGDSDRYGADGAAGVLHEREPALRGGGTAAGAAQLQRAADTAHPGEGSETDVHTSVREMKDGVLMGRYLLPVMLYWYRGIAGRRLWRKRWQFNGVLFAFGCAILVSCNSGPESRHGKDGSLMAGYLFLVLVKNCVDIELGS